MIVSEELFARMQRQMLSLTKAIKDRDFSDLEGLEDQAIRAVAFSTQMVEAHQNGPEGRDGCYGTNVDWAVYGAENEHHADLLAATALRCHSDRLLEKWDRDPMGESFLELVGQTRQHTERLTDDCRRGTT